MGIAPVPFVAANEWRRLVRGVCGGGGEVTVSELIDKLNTLPPDMRVVVRGELDGFNDACDVEVVSLALDYFWQAELQRYGQHGHARIGADATPAVHLVGRREVE